MPRTLVMFAADNYNTTRALPHFINPTCFGDDVARDLVTHLRRRQILVGEPMQEDFGWYVNFTFGSAEYCFVLGYRPNTGQGVWIGTIERARGFWGSIVGLRRARIAPAVARLIHEVLAELPNVSKVTWYYEREFSNGDESNGVAEP